MPGLRSARGRAILVGVALVGVLAGTATVAEARQGELAATAAAAGRTADTTLWLVIGLSALAFLVTAGAAVLAVAVVRPLASLRASARAITSGDMKARIKASAPAEVACLARDFNAMTDALAAKAQEYIDTTNLTGVIIMRVDKDNRVSLVNDAMCEFLGRSREEILGTPILDYLRPEDALSTIRAIRKMVLSKGLVTGIVSRHVTPMGTRVTEWNGYPIFDEDGRYAGVHGAGRDISEHWRAEKALHESERRFRTSVENMLDCFGIYSAIRDEWGRIVDFRVDHVNAAACANNLMSREEQIGKGLLELLPAHRETGLFDEYCQVVETGKPFARETLMYEDDYGNRRLARAFDVRAAKLGDGFAAAWRDVSERKRAEEALRESEAKWRSITEHSPDHIMLLDRNANILFINHTVSDITREQVIGTPLWNYVPPEFRPIVKGSFERVLRTGEPDQYQVEYRTADGDTRIFETRVGPVEHSGHIVALTAAARDISERKRAEAALQQEKDRAQKYLDVAQVILVAIKREGEVALINQKGCSVLGYNQEEIVGKDWFDTFLPGRIREQVRGVFRTLMAGEIEPVEHHENLVLTRSGEQRLIAWHNTVLTDEAGNITGTLSSGEDITERKRTEKALRAVREDIESRVERRMRQVNGYGLTFRELTVLHLVAAGESDKEIAAVLGITTLTASKHLANILRKMGAASRTEAGVRAVREGLLD